MASNCGLSADKTLKAVSFLSTNAGLHGMIGGQVIDIESKNEDMELLKYLHSLKTGAIIRAAGVIGAILSGADEDEIMIEVIENAT